MLLNGRPLYDNRADAELFVYPPWWNDVVHGNERGLNVLLVGRRGSGKTTLLRQIQLTLRGQGERAAFVDATGVSDVLELTGRVRNALREGEPSPFATAAETVAGAVGSVSEPIGGASRALEVQLRAIGEADRTTILLDASGAAEAVYALCGRMRDVLWQQPHRWIVAIDAADRPTVTKPPADAFFDLVVATEDWPTALLLEVLSRRDPAGGEVGPEQMVKAAAGAKGSPREAIRALGHAVVYDEDPEVFLGDRARLLDTAASIGRAPGMLMAELLDREQSGASDEDLQNTLGVSRPRLAQMFAQLEEAGLVDAQAERPSGPGRPRVVYRPRFER